MKKFIWISLIFLLTVDCGSRKKNLEEFSQKFEFESKNSGRSETDFYKTTFSENDLSELLENQNMKISSDGSPYQLQLGNILFSGSADIELNKSKKEIKSVSRYFAYIVYHHVNVYNTQTKYRTVTNYKSVKTERSGISFVDIIWMIVVSFIVGIIVWEIVKKYLPSTVLKILTLNNND